MNGRGRSVAGTAALIVVAAAFVLPLLLLLRGSFRPVGLPPPRADDLVAGPWSLDGYRGLAEMLPLTTPLVNSLLVAAVAVPLGVVVASWAGFAIARLPASQGAFLGACAVRGPADPRDVAVRGAARRCSGGPGSRTRSPR